MRIQNFESLVTVNPNGTLDVSETITANFTGEWHGIYRTIPIEYSTNAGLNYTLFLSDILATDDSGNRLKIEISRNGPNEQFKIYIPDAVDATRTVTLHYHVLDGLRFFPDHDELYWNVTGNSWDVPLQAASCEIELPVRCDRHSHARFHRRLRIKFSRRRRASRGKPHHHQYPVIPCDFTKASPR